ncbi:MAG TPA: zinc-dependent alcohol dehydrogenase family protein [Terriglobales bacterium]|jgi:propanol-preferring alcohol dehydrogenase|nr:zinc-dependent alcohol dehydrogenase family protein [Terriglobales bacterium]
MHAMVLHRACPVEQSPLQLKEIPTPTPGRGELRVRVRCCGLCHTDLHTVEGDLPLPKLPLVPGHQIVGIVDAVGAGVRRRREGDRVGIPWLYSTDQSCDYCRRGLENLCEQARFTGYHVNGGYAEYAIVHEDYSYEIPQIFSDENAAPLLCAGIIGYRSYRLSGIRPDECLGLYGFGASAHLVLQLARHQGCEVYVYTRTQSHRELAVQLGAAWVGTAEDIGPCPLDAAIIFAPAGALVPKVLRALRKGGTLALAGITMSAIPQMDYSLLYHERVVRSVANSTREDCREFLELAAEVPLRTEIQTFPLDQANQALQALKESEIKGAGVLRTG